VSNGREGTSSHGSSSSWMVVVRTMKIIMVIDSVEFGKLRRIVGGIIRGCRCLLVASSRRSIDGIKHVHTIGAIVVMMVVVVLGSSVDASWSTSSRCACACACASIICSCSCCVPCLRASSSSLPIMSIPRRLSTIIQAWIRGCGRNIMLMLW
jgi:hypothetical protein